MFKHLRLIVCRMHLSNLSSLRASMFLSVLRKLGLLWCGMPTSKLVMMAMPVWVLLTSTFCRTALLAICLVRSLLSSIRIRFGLPMLVLGLSLKQWAQPHTKLYLTRTTPLYLLIVMLSVVTRWRSWWVQTHSRRSLSALRRKSLPRRAWARRSSTLWSGTAKLR